MPPVAPRRLAGFTLIEILVALVCVAILAAIAWPSYSQHVARAKRAAARAVLLEGMQYMERQYAHSNTYGSVTLPTRLTTAPAAAHTGAAHYAISVSNSTTYAYTLTAVPVRSDPDCGTLTLSHTGEQGKAGQRTVAECWR